jgi:hypothetical protein
MQSQTHYPKWAISFAVARLQKLEQGKPFYEVQKLVLSPRLRGRCMEQVKPNQENESKGLYRVLGWLLVLGLPSLLQALL